MTESLPIILASQSPRRSALLTEAGIPFEAVSPRFEEPPISGRNPDVAGLAEQYSHAKAASLADLYPDRIILAADTIVALGDEVFGKPANVDDARRILSALLGTTQQVITGVTLLHPRTGRRSTGHDVTHVTMRRMTCDELEAYLAGGDWEGKAGAYGIQSEADRFIERCEGSYSNVVGLPLELVIRMLSGFRLD